MTAGVSSQSDTRLNGATVGSKEPAVDVKPTLGRIMVAPLLVWLALTIALPMGYCVWISLTNANTMGGTPKFVAFANYVTVLTDANVGKSLWLTLLWAVGGAVLQTLLAAIAALVLQQRFRGRHIARTWLMASWVIPTVVTAFLWRWMLNADFGVVNHALLGLGLIERPVDFLGNPHLALATVTWINAWRWFPFMTLLILAALTRISPEYYEAANVEGASQWQVFTHVTLPFIQPVLYVVGLLGTLWSVSVFDIIWMTTKGGPLAATKTMAVAIYERAFQQFKLGEASAMSVVLAVILVLFAVVYIRFAPTGAGEQEA